MSQGYLLVAFAYGVFTVSLVAAEIYRTRAQLARMRYQSLRQSSCCSAVYQALESIRCCLLWIEETQLAITFSMASLNTWISRRRCWFWR